MWDFGADAGLEAYLAADVESNAEGGYHETLTAFWIHMVARYIEPGMAHWSYDLLTDAKPRLEWAPPDVE